MINLAWSIGSAVVITVLLTLAQVHPLLSFPLGLIVGVVIFIILGRKIQERMENLMAAMQKDLQAQKIDRAIETLKTGYAFKNRHIFIESQLNSQIGMLYYLKKSYDKAAKYLEKGFMKHYIGSCMLAAIYYRRKDMDKMKEIMDDTVKANRKESICYAIYAYFLSHIKERDAAIKILQKGLKKLPEDNKLTQNLILLQNQKKMKMRVYGDMWVQFMLERAPRVMQAPPRHQRFSKRAMFR